MSIVGSSLTIELSEKLASEFEAGVDGIVKSVSAAATQLQSSSQSMSATAEEASRQANAVAAAAEQATANVQTVASAAEELASSVAEIGRQVTEFGEDRRPGGRATRTAPTLGAGRSPTRRRRSATW